MERGTGMRPYQSLQQFEKELKSMFLKNAVSSLGNFYQTLENLTIEEQLQAFTLLHEKYLEQYRKSIENGEKEMEKMKSRNDGKLQTIIERVERRLKNEKKQVEFGFKRMADINKLKNLLQESCPTESLFQEKYRSFLFEEQEV